MSSPISTNMEIEKTIFRKMVFIMNALNDGWIISKKNDSFVFTKKHKGKQHFFLDDYLETFIRSNFDLENLVDT